MPSLFTGITFDVETLVLLVKGLGILMLCFGLYATFFKTAPATIRMRDTSLAYARKSDRKALLKTPDIVPEGLLKALIPEDRTERTAVRFRLRQAGFDGPNAVRNFFLLRLLLALAIPFLAVVLFSFREFVGVPSWIDAYLNQVGKLRVVQTIAVGVAIGFYGPTYWLKAKIKSRRTEIEQDFPNGLDLLQISTEAGLGLEAAMTRVGQKLSDVAPALSEEFLTCQIEILAGRDRAQALTDMAERTGIEEMTSFVNLLIQSMEYGTSISDALNAYAIEMREAREMKAQEKANKLPVQMSAVMATLMLPALFLITLGPTIIRYMAVFGDK